MWSVSLPIYQVSDGKMSLRSIAPHGKCFINLSQYEWRQEPHLHIMIGAWSPGTLLSPHWVSSRASHSDLHQQSVLRAPINYRTTNGVIYFAVIHDSVGCGIMYNRANLKLEGWSERGRRTAHCLLRYKNGHSFARLARLRWRSLDLDMDFTTSGPQLSAWSSTCSRSSSTQIWKRHVPYNIGQLIAMRIGSAISVQTSTMHA